MELRDLLLAREERARHQAELLSTYHLPLICLTMNVPGPEKNDSLSTGAFLLAERYLKAQFPGLLYAEHRLPETGCEGYYVLPGNPEEIKALCIRLEDRPPLGRLLDLDVLTPGGGKLSRPSPRTCLLCDEDARVCRRRGRHPVEALANKARGLLREALDQDLAQRTESLAVRSLLYELLTTPKPGLVDLGNNGSHRDMDPFTFAASAAALGPFFRQCCTEGCKSRGASPEALLPALRFLGREAEAAMYRGTGGVNTHKGAIFSLGLLSAAAGRLGSVSRPGALCAQAAAIVKGITERELGGLTAAAARTKGERLYLSHGIPGIRGQAEAGFPAVLEVGLPVLEAGLQKGLSPHRAGSAALLAMLAQEPDTALISRSSPERYHALSQQLHELLAETPYPTEDRLRELDRCFMEENLSPGGVADLLALCYFLREGTAEEGLPDSKAEGGMV